MNDSLPGLDAWLERPYTDVDEDDSDEVEDHRYTSGRCSLCHGPCEMDPDRPPTDEELQDEYEDAMLRRAEERQEMAWDPDYRPSWADEP